MFGSLASIQAMTMAELLIENKQGGALQSVHMIIWYFMTRGKMLYGCFRVSSL